MICPNCGERSRYRVVQSLAWGTLQVRRRKCASCGYATHTEEEETGAEGAIKLYQAEKEGRRVKNE